MKLFAISMVRNEVDIIDLTVRYHLARGVDRFFIIDNGSVDGTTAKLARLGRDRRIRWTYDDGDYHQATTLTNLARTAAREGADWVISVDADEFWTPLHGASSLKEALVNVDAGAVQVSVINFVQERKQRHLRKRALLRMLYRVATPVGPPEACQALVESRKIAFVEMEYPPKVIGRASATMTFAAGAHSVSDVEPATMLQTDEVACFHAPLRAREIMRLKAEQGHRWDLANPNPGEAWHLRRWHQLSMDPGQMDAEWAANSQVHGILTVGAQAHAVARDTRLRDALRPHMGWRRFL